MGLVKTRRLAAMQKMQRSKFGKMPPVPRAPRKVVGAKGFEPLKRG